MQRIAVISDTHNLLRPQVLEFVRGADRILHAGDIGGPGIVEALSAIAPLTILRGNNDGAPWASRRFSLPVSVAELMVTP